MKISPYVVIKDIHYKLWVEIKSEVENNMHILQWWTQTMYMCMCVWVHILFCFVLFLLCNNQEMKNPPIKDMYGCVCVCIYTCMPLLKRKWTNLATQQITDNLNLFLEK